MQTEQLLLLTNYAKGFCFSGICLSHCGTCLVQKYFISLNRLDLESLELYLFCLLKCYAETLLAENDHTYMAVILSTCPPPTRERSKRFFPSPPHVAPRLRAREWHVGGKREKWRRVGPLRLCGWGGFNETQEETSGRCILQDISVVVCACMHACVRL